MSERSLPEGSIRIILTKDVDLCMVAGCSKKRSPRRRVCYKHGKQIWRLTNPVRSAFGILRDHAKARRIPFHLTFEQFRQFASETDYIDKKGSTSDDLQIDRKDAAKGYTLDNIQVISCSMNTAKGNAERWRSDYQRTLLRRKGYLVEDDWADPDTGTVGSTNTDDPF